MSSDIPSGVSELHRSARQQTLIQSATRSHRPFKMHPRSASIRLRSTIYVLAATVAVAVALLQVDLVRAMSISRGSGTMIEKGFGRVHWCSAVLFLVLIVAALIREFSYRPESVSERRLSFAVLAGCTAVLSSALIIRIAWKISE